jgi:hypothetical protein
LVGPEPFLGGGIFNRNYGEISAGVDKAQNSEARRAHRAPQRASFLCASLSLEVKLKTLRRGGPTELLRGLFFVCLVESGVSSKLCGEEGPQSSSEGLFFVCLVESRSEAVSAGAKIPIVPDEKSPTPNRG